MAEQNQNPKEYNILTPEAPKAPEAKPDKPPVGDVEIGEPDIKMNPAGGLLPRTPPAVPGGMGDWGSLRTPPPEDKKKPDDKKPTDKDEEGEGETLDPAQDQADNNEFVGKVYSVAAKATNPEEFAQEVAKEAGKFMNQKEKNRKAFDNLNKAGIEKEQKKLDAVANQLAETQREGQDQINRSMKKVAQDNQIVQDALARGYDPQNFWNDRGNLAKVMGVLAVMGGQFGAALTGTENNALEIIEDAIQRDMEAQKDHITYLKEAGKITAEQHTRLVEAVGINNQNAVTEAAQKRATIMSIAKSQRDRIKTVFGSAQDDANLSMQLNQTNLNNQMALEKGKDSLKAQKELLEIEQLKQNIRHKHQQQAMPAGTVTLPGLGGKEELTFGGSPEEKKAFSKDLADGRRGIREADRSLHAIDSAQRWMRNNWFEGKGAFIGKPSVEWQKHVGNVGNQLATMIKPIHDAIQGDPRMTEQDKNLAKELSGADNFDSWWSMGPAQLRNKLVLAKQMMKKVAMLSADKIIDSAAVRARQGSRILKNWNAEYRAGSNRSFVGDLDSAYNRMFRYFDVPRASFGEQSDIGSIRK